MNDVIDNYRVVATAWEREEQYPPVLVLSYECETAEQALLVANSRSDDYPNHILIACPTDTAWEYARKENEKWQRLKGRIGKKVEVSG